MVFSIKDVPKQAGRLAIVTGASAGLGYETVRVMAATGLKIVMACRNIDKAEAAKARILLETPAADLEILHVDLSQLASVRQAAEAFRSKHNSLDILINNAGVMALPYTKTEDGFETQMASNCFGHFLFTSLLLDLIPDSPDSRITWLSSSAHKPGKINLDDINFEKSYAKMQAYSQSKLACLMYSLELDRKLKAAGKTIKSNAAHPGGVFTEVSRHVSHWSFKLLKYTLFQLFTHSVERGVLPILEAALAPSSEGGQYYGPQGFYEMSGPPGIATIENHAQDLDTSKQLWQLSEQLTGAIYR